MTTIAFSMAGDPVPKGRPRTRVRGDFATIYTDTKTRKYEKSIADLAKQVMGRRKPLEGPLSVSMRFRMTLPASMSKRLRTAILSGDEPYSPAGGDLDNYLKAVADALNGVCFIDDKQIVRIFCTKVASERAGVDVKIEALSPQTE